MHFPSKAMVMGAGIWFLCWETESLLGIPPKFSEAPPHLKGIEGFMSLNFIHVVLQKIGTRVINIMSFPC